MDTLTFLQTMIADAWDTSARKADLVLWAMLLHNHDFALEKPEVLDDHETSTIPALTQRSACEVVAAVARTRGFQCEYTDLYFDLLERFPSGDLSSSPEGGAARARYNEIRERVEALKRVRAISVLG